MIQAFLFVRLGEGEVYWNVAWKLQKCCEGVGGSDVDMKPDCTYFRRRITEVCSFAMLLLMVPKLSLNHRCL